MHSAVKYSVKKISSAKIHEYHGPMDVQGDPGIPGLDTIYLCTVRAARGIHGHLDAWSPWNDLRDPIPVQISSICDEPYLRVPPRAI